MRRKTEVKAVKTEIRGLELQIKIPFGATHEYFYYDTKTPHRTRGLHLLPGRRGSNSWKRGGDDTDSTSQAHGSGKEVA
ncbi:hypothetical protein PC117_g4733 [Phytophthora cactorum]|uniref:Uncharacterized protein n=1 Tax=Phytophthora cactorum TaxID=29920 RepID=A0A8T1E880_9STRA|nr:hypothetical protein PC117_g4733 [Phytophthora cactorum]